jgi:hypothetical protein
MNATEKTRLARGDLTPDESYMATRLREGASPAVVIDEMEASVDWGQELLTRLRYAVACGAIDVCLPTRTKWGDAPTKKERILALWDQGYRDESEIAMLAECEQRHVGKVLTVAQRRGPKRATASAVVDWSDERIAELRELVADGLTAGQIATEWGDVRLRNAIIGKAWRLGLRWGRPDLARAA